MHANVLERLRPSAPTISTRKQGAWSTLADGARVYSDRNYTFGAIPHRVKGLAYLPLPCNDKQNKDASYLRFTIERPAVVAVLLDRRVPTPGWLAGWKTMDVELDRSVYQSGVRGFRRWFPPGEVQLGGNGGRSNNCGTYTVVLAAPLRRGPQRVRTDDVALQLGPGQAAELTGVDGLLRDRSFTVEAWVRLNRIGGDQAILGSVRRTTDAGVHLILRDGRPHIGFADAGTQGATRLTAQRWTHLAFSYDRQTGTQAVYVNGAADGSSDGHAPWLGEGAVWLGRWGEGKARTGPTVDLAGWQARWGKASPLMGQIADLRVWTTARTVRQIRSDMRRELVGTEPGLGALYRLDESGGVIITNRVDQSTTRLSAGSWVPARGRPVAVDPRFRAPDMAELEDPEPEPEPEVAEAAPEPEPEVAEAAPEPEADVAEAAPEPAPAAAMVPPPGAALHLGSGQGAELPGARGLLHNRSFTVEAWIKLDRLTGGDQTILGSDQSANRKGLHLVVRRSRAHLGFFAHDLGGRTPIRAGEWTHLAFVYDHDSRRQIIYVNGQQDAATGNRNPWVGDAPIWLGRWRGSNWLMGQIAELRIWTTARTAAQISGTMSRRLAGTETGLGALYPLNEGQGLAVTDRVQAAEATLSAGAWAPAAGPPVRVSALHLGEGQAAALPNIEPAIRARSFAVEAWIKLDQIVEGDQTILGNGGSSGRTGLHLVVRCGQVHMGFYGNDTRGPTRLQAGVWTHVAFVYNNGARKQLVYVNGVLDATGVRKNNWLGRAPIEIGRWQNRWPLKGQITELRVWRTTRSDAQIRDNMNRRLLGTEEGLAALYPLTEGSGLALNDRVLGAQASANAAGWRTIEE